MSNKQSKIFTRISSEYRCYLCVIKPCSVVQHIDVLLTGVVSGSLEEVGGVSMGGASMSGSEDAFDIQKGPNYTKFLNYHVYS